MGRPDKQKELGTGNKGKQDDLDNIDGIKEDLGPSSYCDEVEIHTMKLIEISVALNTATCIY